jgi:hypothetical protein
MRQPRRAVIECRCRRAPTGTEMSVCTAASCLLCLVAMVTFQAGKVIRQVLNALSHDAKQTAVLRCSYGPAGKPDISKLGNC